MDSQIIATILVHLEKGDHASDILNHFTERRNDVILRIAFTLEGIQAGLKELNDVMLRLLSGSANIKKSAMEASGRWPKSSISWERPNPVTSWLSTPSANTSTPIWRRRSDKMFVSENLLDLDD